MLCNSENCRRPLTHIAWVTKCKHAFCEEHALNDLGIRKSPTDPLPQCPVCNTMLHYEHDVLGVNLQVSERERLMMLIGLDPEGIFNITSQVLSFWSIQEKLEVGKRRPTQPVAARRDRRGFRLVEIDPIDYMVPLPWLDEHEGLNRIASLGNRPRETAAREPRRDDEAHGSGPDVENGRLDNGSQTNFPDFWFPLRRL